ncbi:HNH endonuclease [Phenylobacterium sp.]|jgi:hypothetical protein|uniref:HNH endonuclease n=1 Tax=Phenylobacterium sp. TaxID=1871053 RepID=UPI0037CB066D
MSPFVLIRLPSGLHTLIDAVDLERVQALYWNSVRGTCRHHRINHYVQGRVDGASIQLHRWLMAPVPADMHVDHINGDGLDNRRSVNLREVTRSENMKNRIYRDSPLSLGWTPRSVPIVPLRLAHRAKGPQRRMRRLPVARMSHRDALKSVWMGARP